VYFYYSLCILLPPCSKIYIGKGHTYVLHARVQSLMVKNKYEYSYFYHIKLAIYKFYLKHTTTIDIRTEILMAVVLLLARIQLISTRLA